MEDLSELLKYKELLDKNIITQEEFEKKKIELLNLNKNEIDNFDRTNKKTTPKKGLSSEGFILIVFIVLLLLGISTVFLFRITA